MKRFVYALMGMMLIFSACQKEVSFEQGLPAKGALAVDSVTGNCSSMAKGNYVASQALSDSNYLEVVINLTSPGSYTIFTDTVNGYSFKGTGNLNAVGPFTVRLKGSGTPVTTQTDNFTVFFDSSTCSAKVTVTTGGTSGGSATFTVQPGTGGACGTATPNGAYTAGTATNATNTLQLGVNVTTAGTWTIQTLVVDGFSFNGAGNFTATGPQTIVLTASGTPASAGVKTFPVTAGSSSCNFTVTVGGTTPPPPPPPPGGSYFPLTANSYWTYEDDFGDTLKTVNSLAQTIAGNSWRGFITTYEDGTKDTTFYRKDASNNFYNYLNKNAYSDEGFTATNDYQILFLKEILATNATFNSDHPGTFGTFPATLRFKTTVLNGNATVTVGSNSFSNVYHLKVDVELGNGGVFNPIGIPSTEFYFAKGIGLIQVENLQFYQGIRFWQVF